MPTIDEELIQNGKAVFHSKVEHTEDVTFGKNAEFDGQVQINSAKDLKTKDGTSIGGGGESIQDIPVVDVADTQTGTITGELKDQIVNRINDDKVLNICRIRFRNVYIGILNKNYVANVDENNTSFGGIGYFSIGLVSSPVVMIIFYNKNSNELSYNFSILQLLTGPKLSLMTYGTGDVSQNSIALTDDWGDTLEKVGLEITFSKINGVPIVGFDSSADIKVQVPLYRHTITLHNKTMPSYFTFSIYMAQQTEITQETLFNVLNGFVVVGTGIMRNIFIDKISFRNTAEKTKLHQYANFGSTGYFDSEAIFADVFNDDYTLEDLVQIL